jgi:hypothetical protein
VQKSLVNTFLGILTTSEVHELIDIFKGKGRRKITPFLDKYLKEISDDGEPSSEDSKKALLHQYKNNELKDTDNDTCDDSSNEEPKGVLFILDSFRKTRKYQQILKSKEVLGLYSKTSEQAIISSDELEGNSVAKSSKGILINKKHY